MSKHYIVLAIAFGLLSIGSAAHAGKPCPWNDKKQPEKSTICRAGELHQCQDGQWVSLGTKCDARFQDDGYAFLSPARRMLGQSRPQREAIVARIAPQS